MLLGFLNSSLATLLFESLGRSYGGGVLELKVYEAKQFLVIDPAKLSLADRARIEQGLLQLIERQNEHSQHVLDEAVFDVRCFGLGRNRAFLSLRAWVSYSSSLSARAMACWIGWTIFFSGNTCMVVTSFPASVQGAVAARGQGKAKAPVGGFLAACNLLRKWLVR